MDTGRPDTPPSSEQDQAQAQNQRQRQRPPPRRYRYTVNGQTRYSPMMAFYGRRQPHYIGLPIRPAPGDGQSSSSSPPPPYGAANGPEQEVVCYPPDQTYLFIIGNELWCYTPEPRPHSFFVGHDPVPVGEEEELEILRQSAGALPQHVVSFGDGTGYARGAPPPAPVAVDQEVWRCCNWGRGICPYDGWALFAGASCYGCATGGLLEYDSQGYGNKFYGDGPDQPGF